MKGIIKKVLVALLVALVVIQFFRPVKNAQAEISANDITKVYQVPDSVLHILQKACYDCHSNNTSYPWYSNIQPVAWWLNDHIQDGKRHLNFSEFGSSALLRQSKKMEETAEEVEEGEMPLSSYTVIHRNAVLTESEKSMLMAWAKNLSKEIYAKVTPQELEEYRKKQEERKKQKGE